MLFPTGHENQIPGRNPGVLVSFVKTFTSCQVAGKFNILASCFSRVAQQKGLSQGKSPSPMALECCVFETWLSIPLTIPKNQQSTQGTLEMEVGKIGEKLGEEG